MTYNKQKGLIYIIVGVIGIAVAVANEGFGLVDLALAVTSGIISAEGLIYYRRE